jgi:hypothetical protein
MDNLNARQVRSSCQEDGGIGDIRAAPLTHSLIPLQNISAKQESRSPKHPPSNFLNCVPHHSTFPRHGFLLTTLLNFCMWMLSNPFTYIRGAGGDWGGGRGGCWGWEGDQLRHGPTRHSEY